MLTIDNWRRTLMVAAANCPHKMEHAEVLLLQTSKQPDGSAISQLGNRLAEAVKPLLDERDRLTAEVEALRADAWRAEPAACLIRSRTYTPSPASHDGQIHYHEWGEWQPATLKHGLAVTDPARNTSPKLWEMLPLYTATPAAQP